VLARLTKVKGVDYLIAAAGQAAKKLGPLTVTIAGDGPERQRLETLAAEAGVSARFTGWVDARDKMELIRQSDLLAVPSLWPEPFGLVGIEAGQLGIPAVGYDVGGIPDWLIPGSSGELAPADPPTMEGLAGAIIRALADPAHYTGLCRGAWDVAGRYTLDAHLAKLEPILSGEKPVPTSIDALASSIGSKGV
jgi:glycosyltransferase involved in cell wall biosynthesis